MLERYAGSVVVIGASAGGVEALTRVVRDLPSDLRAAVCIVLHTPATALSNLPTILDRIGTLPAQHARDGQPLEAGTILVAPPDHHLTIADAHARVGRGPRENGHRPAIDTLFRSAARAYGTGAIGVVLSGLLHDGTSGAAAIRATGGSILVQDPEDALFPGMPRSVMERIRVDHCRPASELGQIIATSVAAAGERERIPSAAVETVNDEEPAVTEPSDPYRDPPGQPSHYSCPDCGGVLWQADTPLAPDLRCRVGHAYSFDALEPAQGDRVEAALWTALRALEEHALTARRLSDDAREAGRDSAARRFASRRAEVERQAAVIRGALDEREPVAPASE